MIDVQKYRPIDNISPLRELAKDNILTIYRGTNRKEEKPQLSLSWTTKHYVAERFALHITGYDDGLKRPGFIYTASINIDDVIVYIDNTDESEVVQYDSVYDINEEKV